MMKYKIRLFFPFIILLWFTPIKAQEASPEKNTTIFIFDKAYDACWENLMQFFFEHKFNPNNQFKTEKNGLVRLELKRGKLSYIDPQTKVINDTTALAIADVKRRKGNFNYVYPKAGNFECMITVIKLSENSSKIEIAMDSVCVMTEYLENHYLERRRKTKNIKITSTGWLERQIQSFILKH